MANELYMVGVTPKDLAKSLEFYRRLGFDFPAESDGQPHASVKMKGEITFFLNNIGLVEEKDYPRVVFEIFLNERAAVDAKYNEMIGFGYESYRAPFVSSFGVYFALINDPDGNLIMISAE
ncbi:hypothetical protein EPA93_34245 [Ktedonosporobacter rubrisoli]|uniref:VOC domain-containing protein n=1 Tax=Ktedonosporobacter rubrisoli TaxID=2509675 RepID=A0A4P6JZ81_KTERU|nr:VOC family protein [Ktedonosporobacter rubrisoli]QBD80760.1 hypothetical protein EPA93_34245 [Ktedonosporobacter rubrisoli]